MNRALILSLFIGCASTAGEPARTAPSSAPAPLSFPQISRRPHPGVWGGDTLAELPHYDRDRRGAASLDLINDDLSRLDLRERLDDLLYASFDGGTRWPTPERMPQFDPKRLMELGRSPGLGVRSLHKQGITGKAVGVAIIDSPLLIDHVEYRDALRLYEEIPAITEGETNPGWTVSGINADMHGSAVTSIALGKSVGVAPQADLYYIATCAAVEGSNRRDFTRHAQAIERILEVNQMLPADRRIRVISMSIGWDPIDAGFDAIQKATRRAKESGLLVVSSSADVTHGFKFNGLGRDPLVDPEKPDSYCPGLWWAWSLRNPLFFRLRRSNIVDRLMVPMDSRTTASPRAIDEYVFYRDGGWSWSVPYIAGLYALAAQARPTVTPDAFWRAAWDTGTPFNVRVGQEAVCLGRIVSPAEMIRRVASQSISPIPP